MEVIRPSGDNGGLCFRQDSAGTPSFRSAVVNREWDTATDCWAVSKARTLSLCSVCSTKQSVQSVSPTPIANRERPKDRVACREPNKSETGELQFEREKTSTMKKYREWMTAWLLASFLVAVGFSRAHAEEAETRSDADVWFAEIVAGNQHPENNGDAGVATSLGIGDPFGVEVGPDGALYICEVRHHRIRRLDLATGKMTTFAGTGEAGYSGDGGDAREAKLNEPYEIRFDSAGNLFVVEMINHIVRRIERDSNKIETVAGSGVSGFAGDGGPATQAKLFRPHSIAFDSAGKLYIADIGNHRIRRVDLAAGTIESIAGNGKKQLPKDGQASLGQPILGPRALFVSGDDLWIALREGNSIWKLNLESGKLKHIAGTGKAGHDGDGGPPLKATFNGPKGIAVVPGKSIFVVDTENHAMRQIDLTNNVVTTLDLRWPSAEIDQTENKTDELAPIVMGRPHGVGLGNDGSIFIGDTLKHRVLKATPQ